MSSKLTREEALRVAGLARLELTAAELDAVTLQLAAILDYASTVQQVDTSDVEMSEVAATTVLLRLDDATESLPRERTVGQAPGGAADTGRFFRVPKVL